MDWPIKNSTNTTSRKTSASNGFTLIELLVVIAIIAVLAALLLPVISKAKQRAKAVQCLNNSKQLIQGLHVYAESFGDWLAPNPDYPSPNTWVGGNMGNPVEATDPSILQNPDTTKLAPYVGKMAAVYKCPADLSDHVRSVSMSQAVGVRGEAPIRAVDGRWLDGTGHHTANSPWRTYGKLADAQRGMPAELWVFIDENERTITDAAFALSMTQPTKIVDWPGTRHNFGASISFADGHAETHHWSDSRTAGTGIIAPTGHSTQSPDNADITWLQQRTSALANAP